MQRRSALLWVFIMGLGAQQVRAGQGTIVVPSNLRSVTVFRAGAELLHTATAGLAAGNTELVIEDISDHIEPGTIRVGATGNLTILSVTFSTKFEKLESVSRAIKKLEDSIGSVKNERARLDILIGSDNELLDMLRANKSIGGAQTGLNVAELEKMVAYYKERTLTLLMELSGYKERSATLDREVAGLENQVKDEQEKSGRLSGIIIVQLVSPLAESADFTVSYITPDASWTPFYDLKADNTHDPLRLLYKARLVQTSGIDWKQVKLTLSTAVPNEKNEAPELQPWFLSFVEPVAGYLASASRLDEVVVVGYGTQARRDLKAAPKSVSADFIVNEHTMNTSFDIDIPYTIPGNGEEQDVTMKELQVPCTYQYYVAPALDENVYLLSKVPGWEKLNLLPGEANITAEGTYIGRSTVDPESTEDTLNLTLGSDKRITVKREKLSDYSSVKFLGGTKKQVFTYEITVRNNKKEKIQVLVKDEYPNSTNKDIETELLESSGAEVNAETGMLGWTADLEPGQSKKYRISYSVKYPKDKKLNFK